MRLESLTLDCYGPFLHQEIVLDPAPGRINLLVAPNGAGKSVLRNAFADLLFNPLSQSPMTFAHPASRLRLTARVRLPDGSARVLVRRKGQGNTLSDGSAPVPPEDFAALLGGADAGLFKQLFSLDSHDLRKGGAELSRASGRLGHMLLAGSGGLGQVQRLLDALARERDAIGRADHRHIARPLWGAAAEAATAKRQLDHAALRPEAWHGLEKRADEVAQHLAALRGERHAVEQELAQLTALRAVRPWLSRRDAAAAVLAGAGDVPRLEPGFEARWRRAVEDHTAAAAAAAERARKAAEAEAALEGGAPDTTLPDAAERIEAVLRDGVEAATAIRDLPGMEDRHREARNEVNRLRGELGWDESVAVPPAPALTAARALLGARAGLIGACQAAGRELATAEQRQRRAQSDLAALPPAEDTAALGSLVREIRAAGDPARRLEAARQARRDAEATLAAALAALPERALTREQLAATAAPTEPALAACETALAEAEAACRDAAHARDALQHEQADAEATLSRLTREADLPAPGALDAARAARDGLWDVVAGGGSGAALAFERALRHADAVADRLIVHATQAAQADELRRVLAELAVRKGQAGQASGLAAERLQAARAALVELARGAGAVSGHLPAALRQFLRARETALEKALALDHAASGHDHLVLELDSAARRLVALGVSGAGLVALLDAADARIEAAREAEGARKAATAEARKAERDLLARREDATRAAQALVAWEAGWRGAVAALARPGGEPPDVTGAALELIEPLRSHEAAAAVAAIRIDDMRAAIGRCAAGIGALCADIAPDLAGLPPPDAIARLKARLDSQRAAATRHDEQLRARDADRTAAARAAEKARGAAAALAALRAALGVADDEAAGTQLERARRVAAAEAELAEARRQILAQGGGRTEAELDALAAAGEAEGEGARVAELAERQTGLAAQVEAASAEARSAAEARDRAGKDDAAQDAATRREAALAALARHAEEALVLHAASSLLRAGLEAGRDAEGSASVRRIGEVFRDLTCGAHAGVRVEDEGTDRVLVALEADARGCKQVKELSEGTSDQLFLALRIAALEAYVRHSPALPFVADDVLQTFDDERAAAALLALLGLSEHVQVIVLTHHPHVRTLARALPAGAVRMLVLPDLAEAA